MKKCLLLLAFVFINMPWMNSQNLYKVNSISPIDTNFQDLDFLKPILKDVKIVSLGEQSHGDGATFNAKIRLIKFLHEQLGYNVIAFESGMFDCLSANKEIESGQSNGSAIFKAIFDIWNTKEVKFLSKYLEEARYNNHFLKFSGFDCQFAGNYSKLFLYPEYIKFRKNIEEDGLSMIQDSIHFKKALEKAIKYSNFPNKMSNKDTSVLSEEFKLILALPSTKNDSLLLWKKIVENIEIDYRRKFYKNNMRDSMMGENLLWLSKNLYPNDKIIIWAANYHIAYNKSTLSENKARISMGDILKKQLGNNYYSILFTSYQGRAKSGFINLRVKLPPQNSIETFLSAKNEEFLYVNFRGETNIPDNFLINSKVFGHSSMRLNIAKITDGLFFIKNMYPSKY